MICRAALGRKVLSFIVLCSGLYGFLRSSPAAADRILDLSFWSPDQSELALGGLWEFHAQTLLEPEARGHGSELWLDISQAWADFKTLSQEVEPKLDRGSYAMLLKGLNPRTQGYTFAITDPLRMTRLIAAPLYAPERKISVTSVGFLELRKTLLAFLSSQLRLHFFPRDRDEAWLLIIQRWDHPVDEAFAVPRLSAAP